MSIATALPELKSCSLQTVLDDLATVQLDNVDITKNKTREVWHDNFERELDYMSRLAATYGSYISVDTEFPGFLYRTPFQTSVTRRYRDVKRNVDTLKIVQLGLTLYNEKGETLGFSWQINFKEFDPSVDFHGTNAVEFLHGSGINLDKNRTYGVDAILFSKLLWEKLISQRRGKISWLTFHGIYDLGYMVKLFTGLPLPDTFFEFSFLFQELLGDVYDVKYIAGFYGFDKRIGLAELSKKLGVNWEGQKHQAGYDSMITGLSFWKIKKTYHLNEDHYAGILYSFEGVCPLMPRWLTKLDPKCSQADQLWNDLG